jgi:NAD+ diphosphatase
MTEALDLPLARSAVNRDYLSRSKADLFEELIKNPKTKYLPLFDGKVLLNGPEDHPSPELRLFAAAELPTALYSVYLGAAEGARHLEDGTPIVLNVYEAAQAEAIQQNPEAWVVLRKTGAGLSAFDAGIYAQALALFNWHKSHGFCPKCGVATEITEAGWVRKCLVDAHEVYPRTDPAIIVSVIDDQDRILLGSQGVWEENRWSVLAGFVEPGESLNAAVVREIYEEAGVKVVEPVYLASQSWPFPYSLMLGFTAKVDPDHSANELVPDGAEIEKLKWFSREEILAEAENILLPGRLTISRALIENWLGQKIISATELNTK